MLRPRGRLLGILWYVIVCVSRTPAEVHTATAFVVKISQNNYYFWLKHICFHNFVDSLRQETCVIHLKQNAVFFLFWKCWARGFCCTASEFSELFALQGKWLWKFFSRPAVSWEKVLLITAFATSMDLDEPAHPHSLIWIHAVHIKFL